MTNQDQVGRWIGAVAAVALTAVLIGAGCGDDSPNPTATPEPTPTPAASLLEAPPEGQGVQLTQVTPLEPGQEGHTCQYYALPFGAGNAGFNVKKTEHAYNKGVHRLIFYRSGLTRAEVPTWEAFDCGLGGVLGQDGNAITYLSQVAQDRLAFPEGVAMKYPAEAIVIIEAHQLNPSTEKVDSEIRVNLWYDDEPVTAEAGSLFMYALNIVVPPMGSSTTKVRCNVPSDINLLNGIPHMHGRGVGYRSWKSTVSPTGETMNRDPMVMAASYTDSLEARLFQPSLPVRAGQAIEFECDYLNTEGRAFAQGPTAKDHEMCMFIGLYYPRMDDAAELCTGNGSGTVLEGTKPGAEVLGCFSQASAMGDQVAAQKCVLDTCPGSAAPVNNMLGCGFAKCGGVCPGPNCQACVQSECAAEVGAVLTSSCQ